MQKGAARPDAQPIVRTSLLSASYLLPAGEERVIVALD
jgi:hypothetical protein